MGADFGYRGKRLGLPEEGSGSIASVGRRFGAIFIDWAIAAVIAFALTDRRIEATNNWALVVFLVMTLLTVGTVGSTLGKRLVGLRVVSLNGLGKLPVWRTLVRTVLLGLAIPALIWDRDNRGLHDRLSGAVQVRI